MHSTFNIDRRVVLITTNDPMMSDCIGRCTTLSFFLSFFMGGGWDGAIVSAITPFSWSSIICNISGVLVSLNPNLRGGGVPV